MAGIYKGLTVKLSADTTGLSDALNKIDSQTRGLKRNMSAVNKALKLDPGNAELVRQKMKAYGDEIKATQERLDTLKAAESQIGKDGMSTEAWDTLQREIASTEGRLRNLTEEYRRFSVEQAAASTGLGKAGASLAELGGKLDPIRQKATSAGVALSLGVTAPIVAAGAASVKAAVDIDTALTDVKKTVDGTAEDYAALKDAAVEFSKTNAVSASELLSVESLGAQLGYTLDIMSNGKTEVQEFGEVVSGLGIATDMTAAKAGQELAQFFNIMGESKEQTSNYASAIVGLGNSFATTESDISSMSMRIAGAGKSIGLSSADVLGLSTALTSLGIDAEAGGTAISTVMSQIDKDVALGSENLATWAETAHMSVEEFAAAWNGDAVGALEAVLQGMAANVEEGGNLAVMLDELGISSLRQTDMMKRLANSGDLMSRAVAQANDDWRENVALSNEVANRNGSLAAKFDMLRNRITAVAEEVGAPLADAMLEAVDAAEPLFEAIESGAKAFSDMDEGQQRAILTTVALIAALGPALTLFGKAAGSVEVLGKAMTALSTFVTNAQIAIGKVPAGMDEMAASEQRAAIQAKAASTAMAMLKAAAVGLALAGIAVLAAEIAKYVEHQNEVQEATEGLRGSLAGLDGALDGQAGAFESAAGSAGGYREAVDDLIKSNIELKEHIDETSQKVLGDASVAQGWADKVKAALDGFDGSEDAMASLKAAVEGYNAATGSSVEITDLAAGKLSVSTEELQRNTDAWIANAKAQAAKDLGEEAVRGMVEAEMALEGAHEAVAKAYAEYDDAVARGEENINSYTRAVADAEAAEREAQAAVEAKRQAVEDLDEQYRRYTKDAMVASQTTEDFRKAIEAAGGDADAFNELGERLSGNVSDFASGLSSAGISAQDFAKVGVDAFELLYERSGQDMAKVKANIDGLNEAGIDPKELHVTDRGTIEDSKGRVIDLDRQTIDDKDFSVHASTEQAEAALSRVKSYWDSIQDKEVTLTQRVVGSVSAAVGHAAGGISPLAARRIPRHADGGINGILTRATMTSAGIVAEDGNELIHDFGDGSAIVPIQNSRYVRPLAQSIAREMGGMARGGNSIGTVNMTIFPGEGIDAVEVAEAAASRVRDLLNMGD